MSVRSKQLGLATAIGTGGTVLYTTPTGFRTIVKSIAIQNAGGSTARVIIGIFSGSTALMSYARTLGASASTTEAIVELPWIVLEAGQSLKIIAGSGTFNAVASGAELQL